jgi:hypothetical protein
MRRGILPSAGPLKENCIRRAAGKEAESRAPNQQRSCIGFRTTERCDVWARLIPIRMTP